MNRQSSTGGRARDPFRVSLPRFILLATSVFLLVGLGALVAAEVTGRAGCVDIFFRGPGAVLLVMLAFFEFSLARMVVRQFSNGEPLQPAWFLIMLSGGCHLLAALCVQILGVGGPLEPPAHWQGPWSDATATAIYRFGLIAGGPVQMALLAAGLFFLLRLCWESRIAARLSWLDSGLLLVALTGAACRIADVVHGVRAGHALAAYDLLEASSGPLLVLLLIEAILVKRFMSALGDGMITKCWTLITAAVFLTALANMGLWASADGILPQPLAAITWYIRFLAATAYALGPAWQIEAVQSACGEVGVARFSPFASSLAALRLINRAS